MIRLVDKWGRNEKRQFTIAEALVETVEGGLYDCGELETLRSKVDNLVKINSRLIYLLAVNGALTDKAE